MLHCSLQLLQKQTLAHLNLRGITIDLTQRELLGVLSENKLRWFVPIVIKKSTNVFGGSFYDF